MSTIVSSFRKHLSTMISFWEEQVQWYTQNPMEEGFDGLSAALSELHHYRTILSAFESIPSDSDKLDYRAHYMNKRVEVFI
jgi:hypothetical protein